MIKKTLKWLLSFYDEPVAIPEPEPPKEEPKEEIHSRDRDIKDLLRENLALVNLDIFYIDNPLLKVAPDQRLIYLKKFWDLCADPDIMEQLRYLINTQVRVTMQLSKEGVNDTLGAMNINGIATVKDTFEKLANTYVKENVPAPEFNRFKIH